MEETEYRGEENRFMGALPPVRDNTAPARRPPLRGMYTPLLLKIAGIVLVILGMGLAFFLGMPRESAVMPVILGLLILQTGAIVFFVYSSILRPIERFSHRVLNMAEGDISQRLSVARQGATGLIALGVNRFAERLSEILFRSSTAVQDVCSATSDVMAGSREIMKGAGIQVDAIESTSLYIGEINTNIQNVAATSTQLATSSKESTEAMNQMASAVEHIAKNTSLLSASVNEVSTGILSTSSEIQKIDDSLTELLMETESISASMIEMDQSLKGTHVNMLEMMELAQEVNTNADFGRKKVELTQDSISGIKNFSKDIYHDVRNLEKQTENIGRFLDVIDDMADQTNLLALNAEIIAAQEGEHGKSFSVVANEIKELSERTAASTHEIHEIIKALQSDARKSVETIAVGNEQIEVCVNMAKSAQEALAKIHESSNRSTQRTGMVVNTIKEQSNVIRQVGISMMHMNDRAHDVAKATSEQNRKSENVIETTYSMKSIMESLEGAMNSHAKGMKKVQEVADRVWRMAREIAKETSHQKGQSQEMVQAIRKIKDVTRETVETMGDMGNSVEKLIKQARVFENEIAGMKFQDSFKT